MDAQALTVRDLARRWDCSEMTVRRLIWAGELRAFKIGARGVRIPLAEVERYERENAAAKEERRGGGVAHAFNEG